jgi:hypothetical protein
MTRFQTAITKIKNQFEEFNKSIFLLSITFGISRYKLFKTLWAKIP